MRDIIVIPHPSLRKKARLITNVDKKLKSFIKELETILDRTKNPRGVGLAAPQVDKLWRIFSMRTNDNLKSFINPVITKKSKSLTLGPKKDDPIMEGCLSMPSLYGPVFRRRWIEVEYQFIENNKLLSNKLKLEDYDARVFQHELDHLDGILFTDHSLKYDLPIYREYKKGKYEEVDKSLLELF